MIGQNVRRTATLFGKIRHLLPEHLYTVESLVERLLNAQPNYVASHSNGSQMSVILGQLAMLPGADNIADPVVWQREVRQDRDLFND